MIQKFEKISSNPCMSNIPKNERNICSVGLESECPGIGKIEGELFIPEGELFIPRLTVVWPSVARPDSRSRNGKFDRAMKSKPKIFPYSRTTHFSALQMHFFYLWGFDIA